MTHRKTISDRVRTVLTAALAATGVACAAPAAHSGPVDLQVVNRETGEVLRLWRHDGRLFVAGQPGGRYSLRVTNHSDGRVLVVMSVDGVNILTGETAGYDQRGYVFDPHESYDVKGWRKSDSEVAAFTFAPLSQSYAARTGRPTDVGVIGMAVFTEKVQPPPPPPPEPEASEKAWRDGPIPAPAAAPPVAASARAYAAAPPAPEDEKLGTGHGAREWSEVTTVAFERASSHPQYLRRIEYDTYAHLVAAGVIPAPEYGERPPRPFPSNPDGQGYVPDPPDEP